ncbi:MAG: cellulase family glycosylhydrolase [Hungateiclostridium thermocellum]|nr:cellulase family glycosylhydrolase [Acetivibrio thermocellus]
MKKIVSLVCVLVMLVSILGSFSVVAASPVKGFQVSGTKLLDASGNELVMRGMRDISAIDLVKEIKIGWNLGNTLDAPTETAWGNPRTTKAMIEKVREMGFNAVRVPVTWDTHIGPAPDYKIDEAWLNRVEEVVNYVLDCGMYAIINVHHDNTWIIPTYANEQRSKEKLVKVWEQIATRFKDYDDHLLFETMNEPREVGSPMEWMGGTYENRDVINRFNLAVVNTIRASGGNNDKRFILVPTNAATGLDVALNDLVIPNNDSRVIVSIHAYSPYFFAMDVNGTSYWGSDYDKASFTSELDAIYNRFVKNGRAVIIGEFGTIDKNNLSSRVAHAEHYAREAVSRGIAVFWWDNGYYNPGDAETYALLNRRNLTWYYPEIVQALMRGAGVDPLVSPTPTPTIMPTPSPTVTANILYGDVNGDGRVNSTDCVILQRYILRSIAEFPSPDGAVAADVNADKKINSTDLALMKKYILLIIDKFPAEDSQTPDEDNPGILYNGRFDFSDPNGPKCAWSGSNVELNFYGTEASVTIKSGGENWFQAIVDGNPLPPFSVNATTSTVKLVSGLAEGAHHLVLWKRTEASLGEVQFLGFDFGSGKLLAAPKPLERKIEFIGDSITCAYGNEGTSKEQSFTPKNENSYMSYAAITARNLNASANMIAWSGIGLTMNYGGAPGPLIMDRYPYTLPYSGVRWDFSKYVPQVVVINLGTNDFSTSFADKTKFVTAYKNLISEVRRNYPDAHIFCCVGPMLWGTGLDLCRSYVTEVVNDCNRSGDLKVYFVEFPQQDGSTGYGEDWHPSIATHQLMAERLTAEIKNKLGW